MGEVTAGTQRDTRSMVSEVVVASMVVIGDEILAGHVVDANTSVLARLLGQQGVTLERVHTVADDAGEIASALHPELQQPRPRLLVTSGGIGSTPDDITFEAIAAALGRETVRHPVLEERINAALAWQAEAGLDVAGELSDSMMRMAEIPAGAHLLEQVAGWVPAVVLDLDGGVGASGVTVAILPGVPSEFARIAHDGLVPLVAGRNLVPDVIEVTHGFPESLLNPVFTRIVAELPGVRLGSYPGRPMLVRLTGPVDEVAHAAELVRSYLDDLSASRAGQRIAAAWAHRSPAAARSPAADPNPTDATNTTVVESLDQEQTE